MLAVGLVFQALFIEVRPVAALTVAPAGRWSLDEDPIEPASPVSDEIAGSDGRTPSDWNGSSADPLAPTGTGAIWFPGWTRLTRSDEVDATASSVTIPSRSRFNPETKDFIVSVWVRSLDPGPLLTSSVIHQDDTLNIVQKGLATGQQWKMSVDARGRFICTFRGPDDSGRISNHKAVSRVYEFDVVRQVSCSLSGGIIRNSVTTGAETDVSTAVGPSGGVKNGDDITVGKKPGSTDPGDAFAGVLDNLVISKGE